MVSEKKGGRQWGSWSLLFGGSRSMRAVTAGLFAIFSDLQSEAISAASLSLPAVHVFSIQADEGINQSVARHFSVGRAIRC